MKRQFESEDFIPSKKIANDDSEYYADSESGDNESISSGEMSLDSASEYDDTYDSDSNNDFSTADDTDDGLDTDEDSIDYYYMSHEIVANEVIFSNSEDAIDSDYLTSSSEFALTDAEDHLHEVSYINHSNSSLSDDDNQVNYIGDFIMPMALPFVNSF